ncbi:hypothetical protein [Streptomyces sp. NPDC002276]
MAYRRRKNLLPSIAAVLESMGVRAWIHEGRVYHDGPDELRDEIGNAIERVRPTGVRESALFFGAVLVVAMDRGNFTRADIKSLDDLGYGNANYLLERLEKLKEIESD